MIKNPTPRHIVLLSISLISLIVFFMLLLVVLLNKGSISQLELFLIPTITFLLGYIVFSLSLERFIYRKIKVIYKYISSYKKHVATESEINLKDNVIENVTQDVSDWAIRKKEEIAQLKKTEKFRREYIGNVSHELKTPIFNIQGYLETLLENDDKKIHTKFLRKALKNANRLGLIIEDLEMISKNETGNLHLEYSVFSLNQLISEVIDSFDIEAKEKFIHLGFKDLYQTDFTVNADRERIRQVLNNLVSNALRYSDKNTNVVIACYDMEDRILIEVTDQGIGIEEKHLSRLYERFYRVDKDRSRNKGGTGIGLSIVKHIIEAHRESINIRSSIGVGSTFGFTLKKASSQIHSLKIRP